MDKPALLNASDASKLVAGLRKAYPNAKYYLDFKTPIDLMAAAILSAQTRDETVNKLTPALFAKYKTAKDYSTAKLDALVNDVKSVSFAGNKAKNIIATSKIVQGQYAGKVPKSIDQLAELPGIGRKTANTIMINAYGIVEGIPVDTWVIRLSFRLGLSANKNPDKIEGDLKKVVPRDGWHNFAYVLKTHGKTLCKEVPMCSKCPVGKICPKNGVTETL
ncbi:MAG TPA: endonuclease III [Candidatus Acidoferrales bacterium]|nr:endonuclease III [Candidatus Acidoferrales bacterium]